MPSDNAPTPRASSKKNSRKFSKRLKRPLLIFGSVLVGLILLLLVLAGPAFPAFGKWAALKAAESQGITGDLRIEGSLFSGFAIREIELKGTDSPLVSLSLKSIVVDYDFAKVVSAASELNWLNLLRVENAVIDLNVPIAEEKATEEKTKEALHETADDFSPIWNLLNSQIEIANISVNAQIGEEKYHLGSLHFNLPSEKEGGLSIESIGLPGKDPISSLSARISHEEQSLTLDQFSGKEIETIHHLTLTEKNPGDWTVDAALDLGGGRLSIFAATGGEVSIRLPASQSIDLAKLPREVDGPQLKGTISDLNLNFSGDFEAPSSWQIDGQIIGRGIGLDATVFDSLAVIIADNRLNLDLLAPGMRLSATASAPLDTVGSTEEFATMPVDLAADLKLESLAQLLAAWEVDLPLTGAIDGRVENVQLVSGKSLRSGSVLLLSDTLAWDGEAITTLQVAAQVPETDKVKLAAEAGLDELTVVNLNGEFLLDSLSYQANLEGKFDTAGVLGEVLARLSPSQLAGSVELKWNGSGNFEPNTHSGKAMLSAKDLTLEAGRAMQVHLEANYTDDHFLVPSLALNSEPLSLAGKAEWKDSRISVNDLALALDGIRAFTLDASLPFDSASENTFLEQQGEVAINLSATDLRVEELVLLVAEKSPLTGALNGQLGASGSWQSIAAKGKFDFRPMLDAVQGDPALNMEMQLTGNVFRPESWDADFGAILSGLKWDEIQLGDLALRAATREEAGARWLDAAVNATQEGATLNADARLDLSGASSFAELKERPLDLEARINAPDLAPLWQQLAPPKWRNIPLAGDLSLDLAATRVQGKDVLSGKLDLLSETLRVDGEPLQRISLSADVDEPNFVTAILALHADELSRIDGTGSYHLAEEAFEADLDLSLDIAKAGALKRLLGSREIARLLPGVANLMLKAKGNAKEKTAAGEFALDGADLSLADGAVPVDSFKLAGAFSESSLATTLSLRSQPLDLDGDLSWDGTRVELTKLDGSSGGTPMFSAVASAPLEKDKLTAADWLSQETPLSLRLTSEPIALKTLMQLVKDAPPVNGNLDLDLFVEGTPAKPTIDLNLDLTNIALPEQDNMKVGGLNLSLKAADEKAELKGKYQHPDINPLILKASLPFFPKEWAVKERDATKESITATAKIEKSSLAFLSTQIPAIKSIDGTIAIDAEVTGTVSAPLISGDGMLDVSRLRLDNRDAPSFYDIDLQTRFARNRLTIQQLNAIVAGGKVDASGTIDFIPEEEPKFDLRLGANEALIFRTPDLSLRTDADLSLTGPWSTATIAGSIGLTDSRFFKNFDLLPQTLPVRNTSVLPTVERAPRGGGAAYTDLNLGVDIPPFRDWNADIRLYTKTPFQVRSNLVESDLVADIRVSGKLSAPSPVGYLAIDEGELSLPFSSIDVEIGRIEFDQNTGFNGAINLKAQAKADKYRINVFLYNRILDPKYVLTSSPPLPSEDLLTLLVTGTTRDALIGGDPGSLAASKAATLLFKNMRKASNKADSEPSLLDDLQERTELEIGGINPETGAQTVGGKIRLWKQLFFVGDVDAENDYRALLKYVFQFR